MRNAWMNQSTKMALFLLASSSIAHSSATVYGKRFCEIVYSKNFMDFYVYNSHALHDCPNAWWKGLNNSMIKKDMNAQYVFLNGPRIWMVDNIEQQKSSAASVNQFQGKPLNLVGSFHADFHSLLKNHGPYTDFEGSIQQVYSLNKGRQIVELVNDQGQVYVLQSISLKHRYQSPENISSLQPHLKLPSGWTFKTGALSQDYRMMPKNQMIHVVQDEYENTYQRIGKDLLNK